MRFIPVLFVIIASALPLTAQAGQAEAKELARNENCVVAGISQIDASTGSTGSVTYKAVCTLPGSLSEDDKKRNGSLTIRCEGAMCSVIKKGE